jgi:hypothetical protein
MSFEASKEQYDCLIDPLPDWVPGAIKKELEDARYLVLDVWGYEPCEAIKWIEYYSEDYVSEDIPDYPTVSPSGIDINLTLFDRTMEFLARTRQAIDLGPVEGLEYFGGRFAYLSYSWIDNLRWDIKEKTAQPEDVELMMEFFCYLYQSDEGIPTKILREYSRLFNQVFSEYLNRLKRNQLSGALEAAFGLTGKPRSPEN